MVPYIRTMFLSAGKSVTRAFIDEQLETLEIDRAFAAYDGSELVGTIGTRSLQVTIPGGAKLPFAAIGQGGVLPSHTRRGAMRTLMLQSLEAAKERGEALAGWTTSEWPLYERYGGGVATFSSSFRIRNVRSVSLRRKGLIDHRVILGTSELALTVLPELHLRASDRNGGVPRNNSYWKILISRLERGEFLDVLESRAGQPAPLYCVAYNGHDTVVGCGIVRIHQLSEGGLYRSTLEVLSFVAVNDNAKQALWTFLLGMDLVEDLLVPHGPPDALLRWMLEDGRRLETLATQDHVWLRIIDPLIVLRSRWFPLLERPLIISVHDPLQTSCIRSISIESNGQQVAVEHTSANADAAIELSALSSLVLGGVSISHMISTGRLRVESEGVALRLATAFAVPEFPFTDNSF